MNLGLSKAAGKHAVLCDMGLLFIKEILYVPCIPARVGRLQEISVIEQSQSRLGVEARAEFNEGDLEDDGSKQESGSPMKDALGIQEHVDIVVSGLGSDSGSRAGI